ncbi:reverse transcriptase domain-containing protein, partial [Tanacetum coccineum]
MESQYGMPNYGKFLKELVSNKHKLEKISSAFLSDESSSMIQNKVPPKLGDPRHFLIPFTFSKAFSCNALADLGANINLMLYALYAKLSLETLKPTKISVRLADRSFNTLLESLKICSLNIDVIDEILEEDFDALLDDISANISTYLIPTSKGKSVVSIISRLLLGVVSYCILIERNSRLFKKKAFTIPQTVQ